MAIVYAASWKGFRWDVEKLLDDVFTYPNNVAATLISGVRVEPFATDADDIENWINDGNGILFVHRSGGQLDNTVNPYVDHTIVTTAALTKSRAQSNELMAFVAWVFDGYDEGGTVQRSTPHRSGLTTTQMKVVGEIVGPQLDPTLFRDERMTPGLWQIDVDVPHGLPLARTALGLDN